MTNRIRVDRRTLTAAPGFTEAQVADLRRQGLSDVLISELKRALLGVHACLAWAVPKNDVRDELTELQSSVMGTMSAFRQVERSGSGAAWEAQLRLQMAHADHSESVESDGWNGGVKRARKALSDILETLDWALRDLPADQRRFRANPEAVRHIHSALFKGWLDEHRDGPRPKFPFKPSSSPNSRFRRIVETCYAAAADNPDADPERAIRLFIEQERVTRKRIEAESAAISGGEQYFSDGLKEKILGDVRAAKSRNRRSLGQQVSPKSKLLS